MTTERFLRSPDVIARRIAGELVLVPVNQKSADPEHRAAELFVLNETGSTLWENLASASTAEDLAQNLLTRYEVTRDRAVADVRDFLEAMRAIGAIHRVEDG